MSIVANGENDLIEEYIKIGIMVKIQELIKIEFLLKIEYFVKIEFLVKIEYFVKIAFFKKLTRVGNGFLQWLMVEGNGRASLYIDRSSRSKQACGEPFFDFQFLWSA